MAVLKCTICGGELDLNTDMTVGECQYCGSKITIPKNLEKIGNLYNRANFLRQNKEFYQAMAVYEEILREDNTDAEAHWGLVLSKYGIEFVQDPMSGRRLPTCHRTQNIGILSDADYKAAIEFADVMSKAVYEECAKEIARVQARILEISQKEEPFDIFICYKETDTQGSRTEDSVLAQDIYHALEKEGYRVFFARKTLESRLGSEYEPIIFNALVSAKVMLVVGTKAEHYTSTWVRNEWSRYIAMSAEGDKTIIPIYKGISPYELPSELSNLQGLDMSKIGFLQDLLDGLSKMIKRTQKTGALESNNIFNKETNLNGLLKRAIFCVEDGDWDKADALFEQVLNADPEKAEAYIGKTFVAYKVKNIEELYKIGLDNFTSNTYYKRACEFATGELKKQIDGMLESDIKKRLEQAENYRVNSNEQEISIYETVTRDYPNDYHGWWGKILYVSKHFGQKINLGSLNSDVNRNLEEVRIWYARVKAANNYTAELQVEYEKCAKTISKSIADLIWDDINRSIKEKERELSLRQAEARKLSARKEKWDREFAAITSNDVKIVEYKEDKGALIAGTIICSVILMILFTGVNGIFALLSPVISYIGVKLFLKWKFNVSNTEAVYDKKRELLKAEERKKQYFDEIDLEMNIVNKQIEKRQRELEEWKSSLPVVERNELEQYWFAKVKSLLMPEESVLEYYDADRIEKVIDDLARKLQWKK